jgi:hypothetical protein
MHALGPVTLMGASMASERIYDLGPSATSALGAAYESALQSLPPEAFEDYPLLRNWLARHLIAAAFAGEQEPDALRRRAITYVEKWFKSPVVHEIPPEPPPSEYSSVDQHDRTGPNASLGSNRARLVSSLTSIASTLRVTRGKTSRACSVSAWGAPFSAASSPSRTSPSSSKVQASSLRTSKS